MNQSASVVSQSANDTPPLMLSQLIDRLSPPPEPLPVAWWPQTWGWWVAGGIVLLWLAGWGWHRYRRWRANRYRREALTALNRRLASGEGVVALAEVLRRTALAAFPRTQVASLRGEAWGHFLNRTMPPGRRCFDERAMAWISDQPYRPMVENMPASDDHSSLGDLTERVERWIRHHDTQRGAHD
ncbi:DUF4381 domain-containing protein [Salinicola rhizosphaerae]|uniref:DUF4381 domain-containing protein n=1 Tax=Salinicola rhizosphaerae TaxID=1443141 RepID=A0ABQ3EEZ7_9GAMM|nr:DUF4381 domain-containing protein [Salinicola rhizosphaerae]GHB32654.1 hypothetical protein GCM10009038_34440 [Salinicola rhizosphaerae]